MDRMLVAEVSGRRKVQTLLKDRGFTFATLAGEVSRKFTDRGCWAEQVKACIYGDREYPHIRETIAEVLGLPLAEICAALDEPAAGEAVPA
jgi:hypothetical protein